MIQVRGFIILPLILILLAACSSEQALNSMPKNIRQPAVAGQFYPSEPEAITDQIQRYVKSVSADKQDDAVRVLIVPHAGYDFSGAVAAYGYKKLERQVVDTAVIISNSHKAYFDGAAMDNNDFWQTPLGAVEVDKNLAEKLAQADGSIKYDGAVHRQDHNIEVQLPFLQTVLKNNFKILPIELGNKDDGAYKKLARALKDNLGNNDIVVISTDLSHYPGYDDANKVDRQTLEKIKSGKISELESHLNQVASAGYHNEQTVLCAPEAVKTAMELAGLAGWDKIEILRYANSGDAPSIGDKTAVVGYGAIAIAQSENLKIKMENEKANSDARATSTETTNIDELDSKEQKILLDLAKITVENYIKTGKISEFNISNERLNRKQGAFVTLNKDGQLRGCVGQILPGTEPLWQVVRDMAVAACSEDGRFNPVSEKELSRLVYEISVLSVPEKIDDWRKIELGRDGVIIRKAGRTGVFLPQVAAETGWILEEFLAQLCYQKAGLPPDCYQDKNTEIQIFNAQVF